MEHYLPRKKNETLTFSGQSWMLCEISQTQKDKYFYYVESKTYNKEVEEKLLDKRKRIKQSGNGKMDMSKMYEILLWKK